MYIIFTKKGIGNVHTHTHTPFDQCILKILDKSFGISFSTDLACIIKIVNVGARCSVVFYTTGRKHLTFEIQLIRGTAVFLFYTFSLCLIILLSNMCHENVFLFTKKRYKV